jgi:hypothetical protein
MVDTTPEEIYLTTVGDTVFLCIEGKHMWPVVSIKHVDMQLDSKATFIQFEGAQSWTFRGENSTKVRQLLSKNRREEQSAIHRSDPEYQGDGN